MTAYAGKDLPEDANSKAAPRDGRRFFHNFCITIYAWLMLTGSTKPGVDGVISLRNQDQLAAGLAAGQIIVGCTRIAQGVALIDADRYFSTQ